MTVMGTLLPMIEHRRGFAAVFEWRWILDLTVKAAQEPASCVPALLLPPGQSGIRNCTPCRKEHGTLEACPAPGTGQVGFKVPLKRG